MQGKSENAFCRVVFLIAVLALLSPLAHAAYNVTIMESNLDSDFKATDLSKAPDRIYPGDEVKLRVMLSANDVRTFKNVFATVITPWDNGTSEAMLEDLAAGEKKAVTNYFTIPIGTKPGTYLIYLYAEAEAVPYQEVAKIPVEVYEPSVTDLLFTQAFYTDKIRTGSSARILINVTNIGTLDAEDVVVEMALNSSSPFTPIDYDRRYVERISAGQTIQVPFTVGVSADSSPGYYPLTLNIGYSVDNAVQPEIQQNIGLKVEANSQLLITSEFGSSAAGTSTTATGSGGMLLTVTIANVGDTAVRSVYIKASSESYIISGASDKFIGTLNLDDSSTMTLALVPRGGAANNTVQTVKVALSYKDPLNQEVNLEEVLSPQLANGASTGALGGTATGGQRFTRPGQDRGFLGFSWLQWGIGVLVAAAGAAYWWFKIRKKKNAAGEQAKKKND